MNKVGYDQFQDCSKAIMVNVLLVYSGDLKTDPSKTGNIWKPDFFKDGIRMVAPFENRTICPVFKWLGLNWYIIDV